MLPGDQATPGREIIPLHELAVRFESGARCFRLRWTTRGVDVRSKGEIYDIIRALCARGCAVLLASSELEELLALSDRVLVMRAGRLVGEQPRAVATQESLLRLMAGVADEPTSGAR